MTELNWGTNLFYFILSCCIYAAEYGVSNNVVLSLSHWRSHISLHITAFTSVMGWTYIDILHSPASLPVENVNNEHTLASNVQSISLFMHSSFTISLLLSYDGLLFGEVLRACSLTRLFALASNWKSLEGCLSKPGPQAKPSRHNLCVCITTVPQGFSLHAQRTKPTHFTQWRVN